MDIGTVRKTIREGYKYGRKYARYWIHEYIYYNQERGLILAVNKYGKERKWDITQEEFFADDWYVIEKPTKT